MRVLSFIFAAILLAMISQAAVAQSIVDSWVTCKCPWGEETLCGTNQCRLTCTRTNSGKNDTKKQCLNSQAYTGSHVYNDPATGDPVVACRRTQFEHAAAVVGRDQDLIWIYTTPSQYYASPVLKDRLQDGEDLKCGDDVRIAKNLISVRHGRDRDLFALYGIISDQTVSKINVRIHDGQHHGVIIDDEKSTSSIIIKYGRDKDVFQRFCFDGQSWTKSDVSRGVGPGDCLHAWDYFPPAPKRSGGGGGGRTNISPNLQQK